MIFAYFDPSVMSYAVQSVAGVAIVLGVIVGVVWRKVRRGADRVLGRDEKTGKEVEDKIVRR